MAVELMMGYEGDRGGGGSGGREGTVEEAALAGLRSMERLIGLLSQHCHEQQQQQQELELEVGCQAAVAAVTKFRKVISLLGRTRTGHARFRRAPPPVVAVAPPPQLESPPVAAREKKIKEEAAEAPEAEGPVKVYCPKPIQQRLPPLPHHHHQRVFPAASAAAISRTSSLMSADTASTSSFRPRGAAAASSTAAVVAARPPPSSSSSLQLKRKCGSRSEDGAALCSVSAGASGKCHCTKRRLNRIKENRIPPMRPTLTWRSRSAPPPPPPPPPLDYMLVLCDLISWALFDDRNQEAAAEEDGEGAGDQREDGRHPAGRFLLAQVRPETHQGLTLPQGVLQVQQRAGVPGEEARGEGPGRPRHARRHLRGRARPPRRPPPGRRRPVAPGAAAAASPCRLLSLANPNTIGSSGELSPHHEQTTSIISAFFVYMSRFQDLVCVVHGWGRKPESCWVCLSSVPSSRTSWV